MSDTDEERPWFRLLYKELADYDGQSVSQDVLAPWLPKARRALDGLQPYRRMNTPRNQYDIIIDDLWQWYALSRVNDYLLVNFQAAPDFYAAPPRQADQWREWMVNVGHEHLVKWEGSTVTAAEYLGFFEPLGFRSFTHLPYSPFRYEIVEVSEAPEEDGVTVDHVFWPGLMFGDMMFSRAGVRVRGPGHLIHKAVAENSRLYFTHWRLRRETEDESHGWGHNSQWRTAFHRDYESDGHFHYNVDASHPLGDRYRASFSEGEWDDEDDLRMDERVELLTNRCFVRCLKDDRNRYPYNDRYTD